MLLTNTEIKSNTTFSIKNFMQDKSKSTRKIVEDIYLNMVKSTVEIISRLLNASAAARY